MSTLGTLARLARAGWIMTREGVVAAIPGDTLTGLPRLGWRLGRLFARRHADEVDRSTRLSRALNRLGPSYVKMGQFLATRPDVVGHAIATDLANLQDRIAPFPTDDARRMVEGSLGRWYPVTISGTKSAFWQSDPHRKAVYNQFNAGTVPFEFVKNWKFTILNNENVWAKAMNRVLSEKWAVDRAVDEMIARIKTVAAN